MTIFSELMATLQLRLRCGKVKLVNQDIQRGSCLRTLQCVVRGNSSVGRERRVGGPAAAWLAKLAGPGVTCSAHTLRAKVVRKYTPYGALFFISIKCLSMAKIIRIGKEADISRTLFFIFNNGCVSLFTRMYNGLQITLAACPCSTTFR